MIGRRDNSLTRVELARLEGTVASLVAEMQAERVLIRTEFADKETRLRRLERKLYALPFTGVAAMAAAIYAILRH